MNRFQNPLYRILLFLFIANGLFACSKKDDNIDLSNLHLNFFHNEDPTTPGKVIFTNKSYNADYFLWDFGDNVTSTLESPTHVYANNGTYLVTLTTTRVGKLLGSVTNKPKPYKVYLQITSAPTELTASLGDIMEIYTSIKTSTTKTGTQIIIIGSNNLGNIFEIKLPVNPTAGMTYTVAPQQTGNNLVSLKYKNRFNNYVAEGCTNSDAKINITSVSPTQISGTFSGKVFDPSCDKFVRINSGTFKIKR